MHASRVKTKTPVPLRPAWVSQYEAAEYAGVTDRTIRRYIAEGKLPASRLAGQRLLRIRIADLEALFEPVVTVSV